MGPPDRRSWSVIGLVGVVTAFVGLGSLYAFTVPRFLPADETSHVGYALALSHGELPALDSKVPDEVPGMPLYFRLRREIYTANHPPLYYLVVALPLGLGVRSGHPVAGMELARLFTVALTAIGAVAVWWTARTLIPDRRDVALLAAALTVLLPAVPRFAGTVHNDGFALAMSAVAIAVSVRLLASGPTRRRLLAAATAAATLTLTRAVGIPAAGLVASAATASILVHSRRPMATRVGRAVTAGAGVAGVACLASAWFWRRNKQLYGDIAGSAYNLNRFGYERRGSTLGTITELHWPTEFHRQIWGRIYDSDEFAVGWGALPGAFLAGLVVLGAVALLVGAARRHRWPSHPKPHEAGATDRGRTLAWLFLGSWVGLIYVSTISYIASGGGPHARYLFPAFPAVALLAATAIGALPARRHAVGPVVTVVLLVTIGLVWAAKFADTIRPTAWWWGEALTSTASVTNGIPAGVVWLTVALAVLGGLATCTALVALAGVEQTSSASPTSSRVTP